MTDPPRPERSSGLRRILDLIALGLTVWMLWPDEDSVTMCRRRVLWVGAGITSKAARSLQRSSDALLDRYNLDRDTLT
jgi:hypothetical protein